jgi:hypothetical protein
MTHLEEDYNENLKLINGLVSKCVLCSVCVCVCVCVAM